jgi:hypothetical protein
MGPAFDGLMTQTEEHSMAIAATPCTNVVSHPHGKSGTHGIGFWAAVLTTICAAAAFALGITTPPRSGPFCTNTCIFYPYTDAAAFVPRDYVWMYPGFLLAVIFVVLVACLHSHAPDDKKLCGQLGMSFALISTVMIALDYFIQLSVLQPSLLKGETDGLTLFSQYNPHGVFIALEDLGYLMMSLAFLFVARIFSGRARLERILRWLFTMSGLLAIGSLVGLALIYGLQLEYRFEVAVLTIDWTTLIIAGVLLGFWFRRTGEINGRDPYPLSE